MTLSTGLASTPVTRNSKTPRPQRDKPAGASYDFSAPQYYDFARPSPGVPPSGSWFEKDHSPLVEHTPLGTTREERTSGVPPTVTQNRRRVSGGSNRDGSSARDRPRRTPPERPPNDMLSGQSPLMIRGDKRSSNNVFEETPLTAEPLSFPVPAPAPEPNHHRPPPYEHLFEMRRSKRSSKKIPMARSPQLGRVRTPDKAKLARLRTAAPLLPTRSTKPLTVPETFQFADRPLQREKRRVSFDLPRKKPAPPALARSTIERKLTVPESPMLMTKARQKHAAPPGSTTIESLPVLTARPGPRASDPKKARITVPMDINLATSHRTQHRSKGVQSTSPFSTTSIPTQILQPSSEGGGEARSTWRRELTVPVSPKLHKTIPRRTASSNPPQDQPLAFKPLPVPHSAPFVPHLEHHASKPLPVKLPGDRIAEEKRRRFREAMERERLQAEQARLFHARPAPKFDEELSSGVPLPKVRPLTKPQPFQLLSDLRYEQHHSELLHRLEQEEQELARSREFHAHPVPHPAPFYPKKSTKPLTQSEPPPLHLAERAEKRREFDEFLRRREADAEELARKQAEVRARQEAAELKKLRRELVPQAQPIRHYASVEVKPSERPLTVPRSPALQTSARSRKRTQE